MENRVHVASNSASTARTDNAMSRRKKLCIISSIIIIIAIAVPVTIVFVRKTGEIVSTTTTSTKTTSMKITKKTTDILRSSTTEPQNDSSAPANVVSIRRLKFYDNMWDQTRYWYQLESEDIGANWIYDSTIFRAYTKQVPETQPVYKYHSEGNSGWYNTLQMNPISSMSESNGWMLDGILFYCYNASVESEKLQPIRQYWSQSKLDAYFNVSRRIYKLMGETEDMEQPGWTFDDIVFYALPPD